MPNVVLATTSVVDVAKATLLTDTLAFGGSIFGLPPLRVFPAGADEQRLELVNIARFWRSVSAERRMMLATRIERAVGTCDAGPQPSTRSRAAGYPRFLRTHWTAGNTS